MVSGRWVAAADLCADVFKHVRLRLLRLILMAVGPDKKTLSDLTLFVNALIVQDHHCLSRACLRCTCSFTQRGPWNFTFPMMHESLSELHVAHVGTHGPPHTCHVQHCTPFAESLKHPATPDDHMLSQLKDKYQISSRSIRPPLSRKVYTRMHQSRHEFSLERHHSLH